MITYTSLDAADLGLGFAPPSKDTSLSVAVEVELTVLFGSRAGGVNVCLEAGFGALAAGLAGALFFLR